MKFMEYNVTITQSSKNESVTKTFVMETDVDPVEIIPKIYDRVKSNETELKADSIIIIIQPLDGK